MIAIKSEQLTPIQKQQVDGAYEGECCGCALYLGETPAGEHTYFWHYGGSSGYLSLPKGGEVTHFQYSPLVMSTLEGRWDTDGNEIEEDVSDFFYLVHVDLRKLSQETQEKFIGESQLSPKVIKRLKLEEGVTYWWAGHAFLNPWEMTREVLEGALSTIICFDSGRKSIVVL